MQTEKIQRYSIRKLSIGASSVLVGLAFMGLNGTKVQAAEVNNNQAETVNSEKLDTIDNETVNDNTVKTVKPSINAWGGVQTELTTTDNANSKQSTPDSSKQDNQKIEINTLKAEKPAQNLHTQALFATSKIQTSNASNANGDLATQSDPSKLSKDNFADGTH